jgi:hypothetical protein
LRVCGAEGAVAQRALVRWRADGGWRRRGSSAGGVRARLSAGAYGQQCDGGRRGNAAGGGATSGGEGEGGKSAEMRKRAGGREWSRE